MKRALLLILLFPFLSTAWAQNFQYENYNNQPINLTENWVELEKEFLLLTLDSLASLDRIYSDKDAYLIANKEILEAFDKVEIMVCKQSSFASTLVYKDEVLGDHVERHKIRATRLSYSPNYSTTIIYIDYAEKSGCSTFGKVFLLNTKGKDLLSIARVSASNSSYVESTYLERGKVFKHRVGPNTQDNVIDDEYLKQAKAKGGWLDHIVKLSWFRVNSQGIIEIIKEEVF